MADQSLSLDVRDCEDPYSPTFGDTLDDLLHELRVSQKQLVEKLKTVSLYWSDSTVSRLINNQLPNNLKAQEVRKVAEALDCTTEQLAKLMVAFCCYKLTEWGIVQKGKSHEAAHSRNQRSPQGE